MTKICWRINLTVFVGNSLFGFLIKYPRYPATLFQLLSDSTKSESARGFSPSIIGVQQNFWRLHWSSNWLKIPSLVAEVQWPWWRCCCCSLAPAPALVVALKMYWHSGDCCRRLLADVNTNYILLTPRPVALITPAPADTGAADGSRRTGAGRWRRMVRPDSRLQTEGWKM